MTRDEAIKKLNEAAAMVQEVYLRCEWADKNRNLRIARTTIGDAILELAEMEDETEG